MSIIAGIGKLFGGGAGLSGTISKGIDLISERTEDADKRNEAIIRILQMQLESEKDPVWLRALQHWSTLGIGARAGLVVMIMTSAFHVLARTLLWMWVLWLYVEASKTAGTPLDLDTLMAMSAGPALYTFLKGRGR